MVRSPYADSVWCLQLTLLLPAERLDLDGPLGLPFLLDHLVLLDPPASAASETSYFAIERPFVTLSGLRGVLSGGELVFTSCVAAPRVENSLAFHDEGVQRCVGGEDTPDELFSFAITTDTALLQQILTRGHIAVCTPYFGPLSILDAHLGHHHLVDPANSLSDGRIAASHQSDNKSSSGALCQTGCADARTSE